jgi:hypothetical protein
MGQGKPCGLMIFIVGPGLYTPISTQLEWLAKQQLAWLVQLQWHRDGCKKKNAKRLKAPVRRSRLV